MGQSRVTALHESAPQAKSNEYARIAGRICFLAAEASELGAEPNTAAVLPPRSSVVEAAKRMVWATHSSRLMLHALTSRAGDVVNVGSGSLVLREAENRVGKYEFNSIGFSDTQLNDRVLHNTAGHEKVRMQFGSLIEPTTYEIGNTPLRGLTKTKTVVGYQQFLRPIIDVLSVAGQRILSDSAQTAARYDIATLAEAAEDFSSQGSWIDLIGKENIVLTPTNDQWRVRLIDAQPLRQDELTPVHPSGTLTNQERIGQRIAELAVVVPRVFSALPPAA